MDIKTLLDNLHDEVTCSVCMCTFTDPKQLPCLHSFCLQCLNGIQRTSGRRGQITCPECKKKFRISGRGNPSEFPTNFRINSLLDVLAIKQCKTLEVKCGNCDENKERSFYCFHCCSFWCDICISSHNRIKANKEHRALALKDFQDQDFENILKRPAFCQKKNHERKELEFFCKVCEVAICNACALTDHEGHAKMILATEASAKKEQLESGIKSLKQKAQEKRNEVDKVDQKNIEVQVQVADIKNQVQKSVDKMIAIIEAKKQDIFNAVDNEVKELLEYLALKKGEVENQVKKIESAIKQTETLLKQSSSAEILGFSETFDTILLEHGAQANFDTERIPRFTFTVSVRLLNMLNTEEIGKITVFRETKAQQLRAAGKESSKTFIGVEAKNVRDSSFEVHAQTRRYRPVLSFGKQGRSVGMLKQPWGVAVNDQDEIAVTEFSNHRVSVFSSDGTHIISFGKKGRNNGEFNFPLGIAFDRNGNIVVADCFYCRVQLFSENGKFLSKFGERGSYDRQLKSPDGLSITKNGDIIVTNGMNKLIKIFSPSGECLRKFGGEGSLINPYHCIQQGQYFIVSDCGDNSIKMFDLEGKFIFKFGKKGNKEGEFNRPRHLSVNKEGFLMVCDAYNHRVQVFELSGKFVTKFGSGGGKTGQFKLPASTANLRAGRIVVCDKGNNRIQVFEQI